MEDVAVIDTEWGSESHCSATAEKARFRMEWRESPGALEDVRQMEIAPPFAMLGNRSIDQKNEEIAYLAMD